MFALWGILFFIFAEIWQMQAINVAVNKKAQQSSTYASYSAQLAVDGNDDKNFNHNSCSHTACSDDNPSWVVYLGRSYDIKSVTIANGKETHDRLYNFKIEVFNMDPSLPGATGQICHNQGPSAVAQNQNHEFACPSVLSGRYVKISKTPLGRFGCDALILCEVIVEATTKCSAGFTQVGDSCYHLSRKKATWLDARDLCLAMGADLAIVDSQPEAEAVKTYVNSVAAASVTGIFLGGHATALGANNFVWLNPDATSFSDFSNWYNNQPSNPDHDCVTMHKGNGQWNDRSCSTLLPFLCEKEVTWPKQCATQC